MLRAPCRHGRRRPNGSGRRSLLEWPAESSAKTNPSPEPAGAPLPFLPHDNHHRRRFGINGGPPISRMPTNNRSRHAPYSHVVTEAITDPFLNAWFDSSCNEIGDLCAYNSTRTAGAGPCERAVERELLRSAAGIRQSRRRLRSAWPLSRPDTPEDCHAPWKQMLPWRERGSPSPGVLGRKVNFFVSCRGSG
jgi:hypothetical protein